MIPATLLVVIDPTTEDQSALRRAEQLAVDTGAQLHLFCCDYLEDISDYSSRKDAKHSTLSHNKAELEALAKPLRDEGIRVTTEACWNDNWQESAIHAASRLGASLILKSSALYDGKTDKRHLAEVHLLRKSGCGVLLVRDPGPWVQQRILAAITPDNDNSGHGLLNNQIIAQAHRLAQATQSTVHCVTAPDSPLKMHEIFLLLEDDPLDLSTNEELISSRFGIAPERVHIFPGNPKEAIVRAAEELRADVLIIGTIARDGLKAALIGNTAEKILNHVDTDILVVN